MSSKITNIGMESNNSGGYIAVVRATFPTFEEANAFLQTNIALVKAQRPDTGTSVVTASRSAPAPAPADAKSRHSSAKPRVVASEHGDISVFAHGGGIAFSARLGSYESAEMGSEDDAVSDLLKVLDKNKAVAASKSQPVRTTTVPPKAEPKPVAAAAVVSPSEAATPPVAQPAAAVTPISEGEQAPPDLVSAKNLRGVMAWMFENGHEEVVDIVAQCERYRASVPALAKHKGDFTSKVTRALEVLRPAGAPTAGAAE